MPVGAVAMSEGMARGEAIDIFANTANYTPSKLASSSITASSLTS